MRDFLNHLTHHFTPRAFFAGFSVLMLLIVLSVSFAAVAQKQGLLRPHAAGPLSCGMCGRTSETQDQYILWIEQNDTDGFCNRNPSTDKSLINTNVFYGPHNDARCMTPTSRGGWCWRCSPYFSGTKELWKEADGNCDQNPRGKPNITYHSRRVDHTYCQVAPLGILCTRCDPTFPGRYQIWTEKDGTCDYSPNTQDNITLMHKKNADTEHCGGPGGSATIPTTMLTPTPYSENSQANPPKTPTPTHPFVTAPSSEQDH